MLQMHELQEQVNPNDRTKHHKQTHKVSTKLISF